eukprot:TRINITY_DN32931_c0_g1_i1.p1 TRINITY_DN32931_c0_g1~~TRINITY_DN32931_c0_g1_i1.p1  ORF type:complete len:499 (+),score=95.39 TRINITY_DN32931_c0_g1_i1:74-1498(+)
MTASVSAHTAEDGRVHFGDSLMLRSVCTEGLLQVDSVQDVEVTGGRHGVLGYGLSTSSTTPACHRNVLTISRVDDADGFTAEGGTCVHYGQLIRLGTSGDLHDRPHYLFASRAVAKGTGTGQDSAVMGSACMYLRASVGSHWRVVSADRTSRREVKLGDRICLESVALHGLALRSDTAVRVTGHGNEYRVFLESSGENGQELRPSNEWLFADYHLATCGIDSIKTHVVKWAHEKVKSAPGADPVKRDVPPEVRPMPILAAPEEAADKKYTVLTRIYPLVRENDMHSVRKLRRMCLSSDEEGKGVLRMKTFEGILSWVNIRLIPSEMLQMQELFGCDKDGKSFPATNPGSTLPPTSDSEDWMSYRRFFDKMGPLLPSERMFVVKSAYQKLQDSVPAGVVDISHIQRYFRPNCHPEVQAGSLSPSEAREDFLGQWDVAHHDGLISWQDFVEYYQDVSLAIEDDDFFVQLVTSAWAL